MARPRLRPAPTFLSPTVPLLLLLLLLGTLLPAVSAFRFQDVTDESGLTQPNGPSLKYGGPMLADLNGDGYLDILLLHHNDAPAELYFSVTTPPSSSSSSDDAVNRIRYVRADWSKGGDIHAATAFRYSPYRRGLCLLLHRGGAWGRNLKTPFLYNIPPDSSHRIVSSSPSLPRESGGRGRTALALSLRRNPLSWRGRPDLIVTSAHFLDAPDHQRAVVLDERGRTRVHHLNGPFTVQRNEFVNVVDVDGDGQMELLGFQGLHVYKVDGDFSLTDVSAHVLPGRRQYEAYRRRGVPRRVTERLWSGVSAVAEFDFDNDGKWDLYVARTTGQNLHWLPINLITDDVLLHNVGDRFEDVSVSAGVTPFMDAMSRGVTVGDFDNDGWVDILVNRYIGPDVLLRNKGDGTFAPPVPAGFGPRPYGAAGDMAVAADLDNDGRLDVVVSEGTWYNNPASGIGSWGEQAGPGRYRIIRNVMDRATMGNYVLVRVGNSPRRAVTALHAVVTLRFDRDDDEMRGRVMMRRVGNPGAAASVSLIETVHFGVGRRTTIRRMTVRWTNGETETLWNVASNRLYVVGTGVENVGRYR